MRAAHSSLRCWASAFGSGQQPDGARLSTYRKLKAVLGLAFPIERAIDSQR
ncbi:MAG: hypothetical protein F6J93_33360 [Oscillatoria sp. SIO1A7]|nr:hypothetical protein [Oscillatoria sp. SIO1A7]